MPIVNGVYVAPDWQNDQAPALDAAELSAISKTLEGLSALPQVARVESGSYVGTGGADSQDPESVKGSLTFITPPKIVILYESHESGHYFSTSDETLTFFVDESGIAAWSYGMSMISNTNFRELYAFLSEDHKTISWYCYHETGTTSYEYEAYYNKAGTTYRYIAIF